MNINAEELIKSLELDESFQAVKDIPWALEELKEIQRKAADGYQSILDRINELDDNGKSEEENEEARFGLEDEIKDVSIAAKRAQKDLLVRVVREQEKSLDILNERYRVFQKQRNQKLSEIRKNEIEAMKALKPAKIYPNDPCPCGSGKKYKKCCGRISE